jgi:dihydrofolate reductase
MRKIRIIEHISLDGVIQAPGGPKEDGDYPYGGWAVPHADPAVGEAIVAAHGAAFDLLLGRRTYDIWSGHWPKAESSPMADSINAATKYVATHKPESLAWGPVADLGPDIVDGVRRIKATDGPDLIVWGSSTLTPLLIEHELADEVLLLDSRPVRHRQTVLFGCSAATRTRARQHEGNVVGRHHQHLQAQRAFADRLLRRRRRVSRRLSHQPEARCASMRARRPGTCESRRRTAPGSRPTESDRRRQSLL